MILSANEIRQRISVGEIKIQDFDEARLGPNSYNLRLDEDLMVYKEAVLDPQQKQPYQHRPHSGGGHGAATRPAVSGIDDGIY